MKAVRAFLDFRLFGALPYAGGAFDQPARLMEEMRLVATLVEAEEEKIRKREAEKAKRKAARGSRSPTRRR